MDKAKNRLRYLAALRIQRWYRFKKSKDNLVFKLKGIVGAVMAV